ncbi:MAG: fibronectin type III domain-containing protein [Geodermatophilaceae bacterium]|nr:fibronectin type III domain-containing protein [Geodermatophilaceae bacterium]MDQ3456497.1 fibronectin type III domain-containing protein [Actinomycetota bacterium]
MKRRIAVLLLVPALGVLATVPGGTATAGESARPFKAADLKIEINATDGDAGLQIFLDDEAWKHITIVHPNGDVLVDVQASGVLTDYGLTELFSESSEPPFSQFPLPEFKRLFPEGDYVFLGTLIDGTKLRSAVPLTHDLPIGPVIVSPRPDSVLSPDGVTVRWLATPQRPGVDVTGYQVLVVAEDGSQTLSADLPASARELTVPPQYLRPGREYKVEVLAIETSGNQTLREVSFATR